MPQARCVGAATPTVTGCGGGWLRVHLRYEATNGTYAAIVGRMETGPFIGDSRGMPWRYLLAPLVVALLGLSLTAFAVAARAQQVQVINDQHTVAVATADAAEVQSRLQRLTGSLDNLASVVSNLGEPTPEQFRRITAGTFAREPSLQAVQYARRIGNESRDDFEAQLAARGLPADVVEPRDGALVPADERPEYVVVTLNEPEVTNRIVYGLDVSARPSNRQTLEAARDAGSVRAGGSTVIVQGGGDVSAIHFYAPVYQPGFDPAAADVAARRTAFVGSVGAVLRYAEMIDKADIGDDPRVNEALLDETDSEDVVALWRSTRAADVPVAELAAWPTRIPVKVDGRTLTFVAKTAPITGINFFGPVAVGIFGVVATASLTAVVYKWMDARRLTRLTQQLAAATARLQYLADRDALTGLPHRERLRVWAQQQLVAEPECRLIVMFADLDGFRDVNSAMGHPVGDRVLVEVARRLTSAMSSETGLVSHVGADEFVVLVRPADEEEPDAVAARIGQAVVDAVARPIHVGEREILLTASVGTAVRPRDGESLEQLLSHADAAVREAKRFEPGSVRSFSSTMAEALRRRQRLTEDLRRAARQPEQQFHLVYQAQVDMADQVVVGAEALLRWDHPELGPVSPGEFIPIAEESGIIKNLGRWALQEAVDQVRRWDAEGVAVPVVAVNIAPQQLLDNDFPATVAAIAAAAGIAPERLELEVTESTAMDAEGEVRLAELAHCGFSIAVDDFGSGYSSMARLGQFPAERLKIDRVFITRMMESESSLEVVRAIVALAAALGLDVVAEGVETPEQVEVLLGAGVRIGQGYWFARPVPPHDFSTAVARIGVR